MREKIQIETSRRFDREFLRLGLDRDDFRLALEYFLADEPLPASWRDHVLTGEMEGFREFHLGGARNTLVIYRRRRGAVIFTAVGTHQSLFAHRKWKRKGANKKSDRSEDLLEEVVEGFAQLSRAFKKWWQDQKRS